MWELLFVEPLVKSQRTVLVGYLTISTNVLTVIKHVVDNYIITGPPTHIVGGRLVMLSGVCRRHL